jgi:hypothetical protein
MGDGVHGSALEYGLVTSPRTASMRASTSLADCGRASGSFARSCITRLASSGSTDWGNGGGSSVICRVSTTTMSLSANGVAPLSIS